MENAGRICKTVVVTGATAGIGLATATELARRGNYIIGVGRAAARCELARKSILAACPGARVVYQTADLSSLRQVRELAARIKEQAADVNGGVLDVLINNAATFSSWFAATPEGFELQFAVNHLAPFLLTHALMPLLAAAPAARVITVSSGSHYHTRINWPDIQLRRHYSCLRAYKQSKLANVLFTCELNRRLGPEAAVRAYAADPGLVNTEIGLKGTAGLARWIWSRRRHGGVRPEAGAATSVYLATEPVLPAPAAIYWRDCRPRPASAYAMREDEARRLWELSERMCGMASVDFGLGR